MEVMSKHMRDTIGVADNDSLVKLYVLKEIFSLMEHYNIESFKEADLEITRNSKELHQMKIDEKLEIERTKQAMKG